MATRRSEKPVGMTYIAVAALGVSIAAILLSLYSITLTLATTHGGGAVSTTTVNGTTNSSFGHTEAGINTPLNASQLGAINNAPLSYFERAGLLYLNGSINNEIFNNPSAVNALVINGKASVVYLGSTTCVFCGENRWAMALALGAFGNFTSLYYGYSSYSDYDLPTLYWMPGAYSHKDIATVTSNAIVLGSAYQSPYVNFLPIEGQGNITQGFFIQSLPIMWEEINATHNQTYMQVFSYILSLQGSNSTAFKGTPYTIWGNGQFAGADAVIFGNSTPQTSALPLTYMTHQQVIAQLANPTDQFGLSEYAAADIYAASVCRTLGSNTTAPICSLSAIKAIEQQQG